TSLSKLEYWMVPHLCIRHCFNFIRSTRAATLPVHDLAAVDVHGLAGDVFGSRRGKKDCQRSDVFGVLPAIERHIAATLFGGPFVVALGAFGLPRTPGGPDGLVQLGLDHAGTDTIHPHVKLRQILGGAL